VGFQLTRENVEDCQGVISNVDDDGLLISLAVTCDQQRARRRTCDTHCPASV